MNIWDRFLDFESKQHLFDLKDKEGTCVWDIVRFYIYINLLWDYSTVSKPLKKKKNYLQYFKNVYKWISCCFTKKDYLFFLCSRNVLNNCYFDKNAENILDIIDHKNMIIIETYDIEFSKLGYKSKHILGLLPFSFISKLFVHKHYNFQPILELINEEFKTNNITIDYLDNLYRIFYIQKWFYSHFLRKWGIKKVFLTQNGIQKGLLAACRDLGITSIEFQHGIVDKGHLAYSYPHQTSYENCYVPDKILSFSDFWFNDCIIPSTEIIPIGNDYFTISPSNQLSQENNKNILVISADIFGEELSSFILSCLKKSFWKDYTFYFKLHPNQFFEYQKYCHKFEKYSNVVVMTNESDVPSLIDKTQYMLTIQSTAVYEALQKGNRVFLLKRNSYKRQEHIFKYQNVDLIDNEMEFEEKISSNFIIKQNSTPQFFVPFNFEIAKNIIS